MTHLFIRVIFLNIFCCAAELAAEFIPDADDADSTEPDTAFFFALVQGLNDCVQKLEVCVRAWSGSVWSRMRGGAIKTPAHGN